MLARATVKHVKRLLAETNLPRREIARIAGVNRNTVDAIALGRRADRRPPEPDDRPPQWCRGCGAMVLMPCRLCQVRKLLAMGRLESGPRMPDDPLRLQLRPEHQRRYEQVVARRRRLLEKREARLKSSAGPRKLAARLRLEPTRHVVRRKKKANRHLVTSED